MLYRVVYVLESTEALHSCGETVNIECDIGRQKLNISQKHDLDCRSKFNAIHLANLHLGMLKLIDNRQYFITKTHLQKLKKTKAKHSTLHTRNT